MITQSQIDAMLKQSDLQDSSYKASQIQSRIKNEETNQYNKKIQQSNGYGSQQFQDYQQSRKASNMMQNNISKFNKGQKSSVYDSYNNQQFQSYQSSRRNKDFQRSNPNIKNTSKLPSNDLKPIQQVNNSIKKDSHSNSNQKKENIPKKDNFINNSKTNASIKQTGSFAKKKPSNVIREVDKVDKVDKPKSKSKQIPSKTQENYYQTTNIPYNYNRLQQRQRELLFTTLTEQNKQLRSIITEKQKQLATTKTKYNILLQQKAQTLGNAKQATLNKKLQILQGKYDSLLKQKAQQRAYKTVAHMSKTMNHNVISQVQAKQRQQQLMNIIQKLKQRLISTDKQLKTLQIKMNEGLDYQQQLKRKLHRVEQLQLRLQKMKNQAQDDRQLIQTLKQKTQQQKTKIQQLQQEKNQLDICLKRAQMTQATHSDILEELQSTRKQKQLLQKSLKQISLNFTKNLTTNPNKKPPKSQFQNIEDSNEFFNYKK